jgi:serine/threonine protein phosphatase PrpC
MSTKPTRRGWLRPGKDKDPGPAPTPNGATGLASAEQQEAGTGVIDAQEAKIPVSRGEGMPHPHRPHEVPGKDATENLHETATVADRQEQVVSPTDQEAPAPVTRSAPAVPGPLVIGDQPSFPATLGVIPATPGAMSGSAVPDTVLDGAEVAGLTIRGGSLRGEDHRSQGVVRQDSMGMWRVNDGTMAAVLVCVTDGVSSQPHSHRGAVAVCQLLRDLAQHQVSRFFRAEPKKGLEIFWEYMAEQLAAQLSELAVRQKMEPVTLSTTMAAAFIEEHPADPAERRYVILNVGDATAFVLRGEEFTECLADPHEGPVTESRTWTLPTGIGPVGSAAGFIGQRDMLIICSDGMSNPMRNGNVQEQLAQWWGGDRVPDLMEFGWQLSYRVKSYGDDRTAVCVWGR